MSDVSMMDRIDELMQENAQLTRELFLAREEINRLEEELNSLRKRPGSQGGRRFQDDKWVEKWCEWRRLYEKGMAREDICQTMGIGRATYFRYKKEYQEHMTRKAEQIEA